MAYELDRPVRIAAVIQILPVRRAELGNVRLPS